jgi:SAM-dependent methyltransferase
MSTELDGRGKYSIENAQAYQWSSISGEIQGPRLEFLVNNLKGSRILDAGCGGGAYTDFLSRRGLNVVGVDKYEFFLDVARGRLGEYIQSDITAMPFPDKSFDSTYCFDVLEHVDDYAAVKELARVTRHRLLLTVPRDASEVVHLGLTFGQYRDLTHLRYYDEENLQKLLDSIESSIAEISPELPLPGDRIIWDMIDFQKTQKRSLLGRVYTSVLARILRRTDFRMIYTGLVAVIDFQQ